jgi:hypothetical protein
MTVAISVLSNRLRKLSLARSSSSTLRCSSLLTVLQLLVDRLRLLARGLQLLVGRLQFLVDRDQLLVRRFQLFERGFIFLDHRLQPLARIAQFAFEALGRDGLLVDQRRQHPLGAQRRADIAEYDQEQRLDIVIGQRFDVISTNWTRSSNSTCGCLAADRRRVSTASLSAPRRSSRSPRRAIATTLRSGRRARFPDICRCASRNARLRHRASRRHAPARIVR